MEVGTVLMLDANLYLYQSDTQTHLKSDVSAILLVCVCIHSPLFVDLKWVHLCVCVLVYLSILSYVEVPLRYYHFPLLLYMYTFWEDGWRVVVEKLGCWIWFDLIMKKLIINCFKQNVCGVRHNILQVEIVTQLHSRGCKTSDVCWIEEGFRLHL
jgi:hypothetical protein